jgi:glycine oxidase
MSHEGEAGVIGSFDVAVVGGGVIGCALASELARRGASVVQFERERVAAGASYGAGGMLAPQVEAHGPGPLLEMGLAARALFPEWAQRLEDPVDLHLDGILRVSFTEAGAQELRARAAWQRGMGLEARLLDAAEAAALAPGLGAPPLAALWVPDGRVDAARLTAALAGEALRHGAQLREGVPALRVEPGRVQTPEGPVVAGAVVVATGAWSGPLVGAPGHPVKGQRLLLRLPGHPLRQTTWGDGCYLVPKAGGRVLVGATEEPAAGFDRRVTAAAVAHLLQRAVALVPALAAAELVEPWAGLRPASPDGLPLIGPWPGMESVWLATGHARNGILLAPLTATLVADALLEGAALPPACLPERFARGATEGAAV